ncbi:MAG: toprim domain-containing protein [Clostridiales bacterium]|nr:toprim domain-containing protein [Clostridiales bacterium]
MVREKLQFTDEQIKYTDSVNLLEYARQAGYKVEQVTPHSYKIPDHGGLYIHANGHKWNHFSQDIGGGAIQFVMHMEGKTWVDAVKQLLNLDLSPAPYAVSAKEHEEKNGGTFVLPEKNTTYKHLFAYLIRHRKIDKALVYDLVKRGKIYENKYNSCVFVGYNAEGEAKYAAIRSTNISSKSFRCDVSNSDKSYSYSIEGSSQTLCIFESAIDLMSYLTFIKLYGSTSFNDHTLSLGGLSDKALERYLVDNPSITRLTLCLDNDEAGRFASEQIKNKYCMTYEVHFHVPKCKDWNEDLINHVADLQQQDRLSIPPETLVETELFSSQ